MDTRKRLSVFSRTSGTDQGNRSGGDRLMASKAHREMAAAVGFAEVFSKQVKDYYQKEKPRAKGLSIINRVIEAARSRFFISGKN